MLSKELLINEAKKAHQNKSYLFITLENKELKFYTDDKLCSTDFLNKYTLSENELIARLTPDTLLKYDYIVYNQSDISVNTFIEEVNKKYFITEV